MADNARPHRSVMGLNENEYQYKYSVLRADPSLEVDSVCATSPLRESRPR